MALTIASTSPVSPDTLSGAPPARSATQAKGAGGPPAGGQASGGSAATSTAQQQAALKQLLATYASDQSHGAAASTLSALAKQITADAKALGQTVTLPPAPASAAAAPAASAASATSSPSEDGKVNVTA